MLGHGSISQFAISDFNTTTIVVPYFPPSFLVTDFLNTLLRM